MRTTRLSILGTLSCVLALSAPAPGLGQGLPSALAPPQDEAPRVTNVAGRWELNWQMSDKAPDSYGARDGERGGGPGGGRAGGPPPGGRMGGRGGTGGRGGRGGDRRPGEEGMAAREQIRELLRAPRTLLIVERPDHVTLTDEDGQVRKLVPDGVKVKEDRGGAALERRTRWEGRTLVSDVVTSDGTRVTQTFQKVAEGLQLVVTTTVENNRFGSALNLKRVYDQALEAK